MIIIPSKHPFPTVDLDLSYGLRALSPQVGDLHVRGLLLPALMWLVVRQISFVCARMERLIARFRAGRLRSVLPVRVVSRVGAVLERGEVERVWPRKFGWLVKLGGWRVAAVTGWLEAILAEPEMKALLVAAPQARRLLSPFCRALAVPVHLLRPGAVAVGKAVRAVVVRRVRLKRPSVAQWVGGVPLPRGVLAEARRQRFGRLPPDWDDVAKWGRGDW